VNWLDLLLLALLALAAFKGFQRGFLVELASLLALFVGIWAAVRWGDQVAQWLGLASDRMVIAFVVTFVAVLIMVHLLARALTMLIDLAQLGLPNKLAGVLFGTIRSAFMLSIMLNLLGGWSGGVMPSREVREGSTLHDPIRSFAPFILPSLGETKWVRDVMDRVKKETEVIMEGRP
jgi:membrane protein required for colicin V production